MAYIIAFPGTYALKSDGSSLGAGVNAWRECTSEPLPTLPMEGTAWRECPVGSPTILGMTLGWTLRSGDIRGLHPAAFR